MLCEAFYRLESLQWLDAASAAFQTILRGQCDGITITYQMTMQMIPTPGLLETEKVIVELINPKPVDHSC